MWGGVAGVMLFAAALVVLIVSVSIATILHDDPAVDAQARQFGQCYNSGQNCVVDGAFKARVNRRVPTTSVRVAGSETRKSSLR